MAALLDPTTDKRALKGATETHPRGPYGHGPYGSTSVSGSREPYGVSYGSIGPYGRTPHESTGQSGTSHVSRGQHGASCAPRELHAPHGPYGTSSRDKPLAAYMPLSTADTPRTAEDTCHARVATRSERAPLCVAIIHNHTAHAIECVPLKYGGRARPCAPDQLAIVSASPEYDVPFKLELRGLYFVDGPHGVRSKEKGEVGLAFTYPSEVIVHNNRWLLFSLFDTPC